MAEGGAAIALLGGEPAPLWRLSRASRWASPWPERPGRGAARSGKYSGHRPEADAGGRVRRDLSAHPLSLQRQEVPLGLDPAAVLDQAAVMVDQPEAGDDVRDRCAAVGGTDGAA